MVDYAAPCVSLNFNEHRFLVRQLQLRKGDTLLYKTFELLQRLACAKSTLLYDCTVETRTGSYRKEWLFRYGL